MKIRFWLVPVLLAAIALAWAIDRVVAVVGVPWG